MSPHDMAQRIRTAQEYFNRSTSALTEEDSGFRPTEDTHTVAQQVAHVAWTLEWFMEGAFRPEGFSMDFEAEAERIGEVTSLTEARAWLETAFQSTAETIASKTEEEMRAPLPEGPVMGGLPTYMIIPAIEDHTAHHRGALTVYARLLGKTPPMPYM